MSKTLIGIAVLVVAAVMSSASLAKGGGGGGHGGGGHGGGGHGGGHFGGGGHGHFGGGGHGFGGMHFGGGHHGGGHHAFGGGHFGGGGHGHFGGGRHGFGSMHFGGGHHGGGHHAFGRGGHGFGGMHFGGRHHGGARLAISHSFSGRDFSGSRSFAHHGGMNFSQIRNAPVQSGSRRAMNSLSQASGVRSGLLLSNPAARGQIAAAAALAGWHGHGANGWWRHGGGGYGWVGPLFWPFAYYDIYDYTIWGDFGFWDYGYPDLYAGIFAPYGYDDLAGYMAGGGRGPGRGGVPPLAQMCGDDTRDVAGLPIEQIEQAIQPSEAQRVALDDLANASIQAARTIRSACPTHVVLTASGRLLAMQQRIEAMISAVGLVQPPLEKFYGLLDDEQKARLNALAEDQRKASAPRAALAQGCADAQPSLQWPGREIEARLHLDDIQRAALAVLQDATGKAADMLKAACQPDDAVTPPARLAAIANRLDTMLQAVKLVRPALEDFYATLSDEQKAHFEAIGPKRNA